MVSSACTDEAHRAIGPPRVVFIMGTARSGSTLLGTLIGESEGVFYAGELCDWPQLDGVSTVPHSQPFWRKVRERIGTLPPQACEYKELFEHPAGFSHPLSQRRLRGGYERITYEVLRAVAAESGCAIIVDSSHYPRRARVLRRLLGPGRVRLVFLVRRPSSVAQSFRKTGDKGVIQANIYMLVVSVLAWLTYLTHPRSDRTMLSYEDLIEAPLALGGLALGKPLDGVDPEHMAPPLVLRGNRFTKTGEEVRLQKRHSSELPGAQARITDFMQWPFLLAERAARSRATVELANTGS